MSKTKRGHPIFIVKKIPALCRYFYISFDQGAVRAAPVFTILIGM